MIPVDDPRVRTHEKSLTADPWQPMPVRSTNTYVHPVGNTRLAKNTYGADFHFLSGGI
jgi:hypothetical protein